MKLSPSLSFSDSKQHRAETTINAIILILTIILYVTILRVSIYVSRVWEMAESVK